MFTNDMFSSSVVKVVIHYAWVISHGYDIGLLLSLEDGVLGESAWN